MVFVVSPSAPPADVEDDIPSEATPLEEEDAAQVVPPELPVTEEQKAPAVTVEFFFCY